MERLTRKEALKRCAEMWDAIADEHKKGRFDDNYCLIKEEVWNRLWPKAENYSLWCWACSYSEQQGKHCGENCILSSAWPDGCERSTNSLWTKYQRAVTASGAMRIARRIANKAREELKRLEGEKNG